MVLKTRMKKLEQSLEAKQKFFLRFQSAKATGGFLAHWTQEMKGPLVPFDWLADSEASFLYHLVNDMNFMILKAAPINRNLCWFAQAALHGVLLQSARPPIDELVERVGGRLYADFRELLEEALSLAGAIDVITENYLDGQDGLFADTRAELEAETGNLRKVASTYWPLAAWLNVEPITVEGFAPGHPKVDAKAAELANYSIAHALACGGTLGEFLAALQQVSLDLLTP